MVTLDVEAPGEPSGQEELSLRALAAAVAGSRTYVTARSSGYSFTVIVGTSGAQAALGRALDLLAVAQRKADVVGGSVVCAEVTLVGTRPVPAARLPSAGCQNPGS